MNNLQFIQRLYKGKNCYSDSMSDEQIELLHIPSGVESIIARMISENRMVFLTGNPGDGKTYIIRALSSLLQNVYVITDLNSVTEDCLSEVIDNIYSCYCNNKPCVIAANEFPFYMLANRVKALYPKVYSELMQVKRNILIYGYPSIALERICVIDLNERNLLDKDRCVIKQVLDKFTVLLDDYRGSNSVLCHNVDALKNDFVQSQMLSLFSLISMSGQHFVIRDILGAISYILVSCTDEGHEGSGFYYDTLFEGDNDLMQFSNQFDPVLLSSPSWDEKLWNGEISDGWQIDIPDRWPYQITSGNGSVEEAMQLFKSMKRKFFFENCYSKDLASLQPQDFQECIELLVKLKQDSSKYKRMLTYSMNKLFLSSDEETEKLRLWTSHSYDLSRSSAASVSTRYISIDELDLAYPEPVSLNHVKLPVVLVLTHADGVPPLSRGWEYSDKKVDGIEKIQKNYREVLENHGLMVKKAIAVSSYIEWMTEDGEEVTAESINTMIPSEKAKLRISFDGRWQIEDLREMLEDVIENFQAKMGIRMALRLDELVRRLAKRLTHIFASISSAVALSPIPISDIYILLIIQVALVALIATLSGREMSLETAKEFVFSLVGVGGLGWLLRIAAQQLSKFANLLFPGCGSFISSGIAFTGTETMGQCATAYYINHKTMGEVIKIKKQADKENKQ